MRFGAHLSFPLVLTSFLALVILSGCTPGESDRVEKLKRIVAERRAATEVNLRPIEEVLPLAQKGNIEAQAELGRRFNNGYKAEVDKQKAFEWYLKAAKQGHAESQYWVGQFTEGALDLTPEARATQALAWYQKAAEGCDSNAQYLLGLLYRDGHGWLTGGISVQPNIELGLQWAERAARNQHAGAMCELGLTLAEGSSGTKKDETSGLAWFFTAKELGGGSAYETKFNVIEQRMSREQRESAHSLAKRLIDEIKNQPCVPRT